LCHYILHGTTIKLVKTSRIQEFSKLTPQPQGIQQRAFGAKWNMASSGNESATAWMPTQA